MFQIQMESVNITNMLYVNDSGNPVDTTDAMNRTSALGLDAMAATELVIEVGRLNLLICITAV